MAFCLCSLVLLMFRPICNTVTLLDFILSFLKLDKTYLLIRSLISRVTLLLMYSFSIGTWLLVRNGFSKCVWLFMQVPYSIFRKWRDNILWFLQGFATNYPRYIFHGSQIRITDAQAAVLLHCNMTLTPRFISGLRSIQICKHLYPSQNWAKHNQKRDFKLFVSILW
jgi:hypothetical protein